MVLALACPAVPRQKPMHPDVLAKFSRIEVDPLARTARVEPGVRNLKISETVAPHSLYYAPDPSCRKSPVPSAATWRKIRAACIA